MCDGPTLYYVEHETCELINQVAGPAPAVGAALELSDMDTGDPIKGTVVEVGGDTVRVHVTSGTVSSDAGSVMFYRPKGLDPDSHVMNNVYECPCGNTWEDSWDSGCDDECAACGATISPSASDDDPDCDCPDCQANIDEACTSHNAATLKPEKEPSL